MVRFLSTERQDVAGYKRLAMRLYFPKATAEAELLMIGRRALRDHDVDVVALFVYGHPEMTDEPYDVARVQIATTEKRWSGDGRWLLGTTAEEQKRRLRRECYVIEWRT